MPSTFVYQAISGFFVHDIEDHRSLTLPAVPPRMGLVDATPQRWDNLREKITALKEQSEGENADIKVFFFARHGQGWHNVAEVKYGTKCWDAEMSKKYGDNEITWGPDPELTPIGINQAIEAKHGWEAELPFRITLPDKLYSSPLTRAADTLHITFEGTVLGDVEDKRTVVVLENCREENGVHTCDKRRTRSYIHKRFPNCEFEDGFEEEDELWDTDLRETKAEVAKRARNVLDYIFEKDPSSTYISVTAHGGIINGFLQAIGRKPFALSTGGILPVVIRCQK
ncbi:phosphoglycerate mutase-like protein [Macrolepiota fuliginosa MF-IS2]|uniref:Phosphoglycerate mutase-like protein n=1 Tax=Macrolepiota fuliginosa MF-IS2 TaxID=1400762 RepID=A0A9P5XCC1_9AGAR|nr:phosphoglycerate mutase-like protein [Macrolepiota fuliginosa MF-IS2]